MQDPEEHVNLTTKEPDTLNMMLYKFTAYDATYFNLNCGKAWPGACTTAVNTYGGFWGPFYLSNSRLIATSLRQWLS